MAFPDGWSHKWPIAINADSVISSPVADWPCLVTDDHFPAGAWALMQATGADLRFSSDEDGSTEIYYDDPRLSVAGESAHLYVRVPSLAASADTTIYAWVGNDSATAPTTAWKQNTYPADIAAWWPIEEGAGATVGDRTVNASDGSMTNVTWAAEDGGEALEFVPAASPNITVANQLAHLSGNAVSFMFRMRFDGGHSKVLLHQDWLGHSGARFGLLIPLWTSTQRWEWRVYVGDHRVTTYGPTPPTTGVWQSIVGVYDGANVILYIDGVEVSRAPLTGNINPANATCYIGTRGTDYFFDGGIGMFGAMNAALTADEAAIHHLMLSDPATWATAGELESVGGGIIYPWHTPGFNAGFGRL